MDIFYSILNVVSAIVSIVCIKCLFMEDKVFKQAKRIELVTSVIIVIINIIKLIMEFYMEKSISITVTAIFLWLIASISFAIQYGKTTGEKYKKKLQQLEKSLSEVKSADARIIYQAYFGQKVDHTGDGFIDGEE